MWQQALISVGSSLLSSALGGKSKGGGGKEGDYQFFRPQTPQEIMRDIQAAAPVGETGRAGTIQGSQMSRSQLEAQQNYRQHLSSAYGRAVQAFGGEKQLAAALIQQSQSELNPTGYSDIEPVRARTKKFS